MRRNSKLRYFIIFSIIVGCLFVIVTKKMPNLTKLLLNKAKFHEYSSKTTKKDIFTLPPPEKYIQSAQMGKAAMEEIPTSLSTTPSKIDNINENVSSKLEEPMCKLAQLKLNDPELEHFFKNPDPLTCNKTENNWINTYNGKFNIEKWAIKKHGNIKCDYDDIWRLPGDYKFDSKTTKNFQNGAPLINDFFEVRCHGNDGEKYANIHAAVKPTTEAIARSQTAQRHPAALNLNVYMFGFDSLSRLTFMRKLPKTYKFLTDTLNAVILKGYNIVGDGTPQALIPIFTGKTELELPLTRKRYKNANWVNVYPFVWKDFEKAGYATMYAEDAPDFGVFQYRLKGFNEQPTDHYLRTYYLALQDRKSSLGDLFSFYCIRNEPHHKVHFRYSEDMFRNYPKSVRKFAFSFHATLSHDDLNKVQVADDDMLNHLKFFQENNYLNDTILIFMSDHGHRFDKLRETQQGKLEERLPFFSIVMPPWFKNAYPKAMKNLHTNAKRLTSPFDIYSTLKNLLEFNYPPKKGNVKDRSISLFDEVPTRRTCQDADIALHWCACLAWKNFSIQDHRVLHIAKKIVNRINAQTEPERKLCSKIQLDKVEKALVYELNKDFINFKKTKDKDGYVADLTGNLNIIYDYYQVTFRTQPGNALYEASVTWDRQKNDTLNINLDEVSHINKYGDLPHCIINRDYFQAKWCVCYDKI